MRKRYATLSIVAITLLLTAGCDFYHILGLPFGRKTPFNPRPSGQGIEVFRDVQFADIPVPLSFTLRRKELFSYQSAAFRIGRFRYDGAWSLNKAWWFYFKQMPKHGWELQSETPGDHMVELVYLKGRERCEIVVESTQEKVTALVKLETVRSGI